MAILQINHFKNYRLSKSIIHAKLHAVAPIFVPSPQIVLLWVYTCLTVTPIF